MEITKTMDKVVYIDVTKNSLKTPSGYRIFLRIKSEFFWENFKIDC